MRLRHPLLTWIALLVYCSGIASVTAQETTVYIDPASQLITRVGEAFSINVSITDATNLFGYDFILWYNTTMLDCLGVDWPANHFLTPILNPSSIFRVKTIEDDFNETTGAVRVTTTLTGDEPPKNNSGVLVTITFNSTTTDGPSPLQLYWPGFIYPVKLSDPEGNPIPCNATSGEVTIILEFPLFLILPLFMTATVLAAAVYRRKSSSD